MNKITEDSLPSGKIVSTVHGSKAGSESSKINIPQPPQKSNTIEDGDFSEKATDIINTEQRLIKVEQILKTNPTEQEFLNELNKLEK